MFLWFQHVISKMTLVWKENKIWRKERIPLLHVFLFFFFSFLSKYCLPSAWEDWLLKTREPKAIWPPYQCLKYMISCLFGFRLWCLTYLRMLIAFAWTRWRCFPLIPNSIYCNNKYYYLHIKMQANNSHYTENGNIVLVFMLHGGTIIGSWSLLHWSKFGRTLWVFPACEGTVWKWEELNLTCHFVKGPPQGFWCFLWIFF